MLTVSFLSLLSFPLLLIAASKNYMHGCIYLWSWSRTKAQRPDKRSMTVCAVVLAELQWTNTEIPYLALNTCPGTSTSSNHYSCIWFQLYTEMDKGFFSLRHNIRKSHEADKQE